ncbi:MAG: polysulfide reductase NrfD [Deltaproteobacteria bacterium]|jgi:tetrathionate reductase subunit C|nr:polysulfide reductase NrfD [Deltaproteobacteria bacterium]
MGPDIVEIFNIAPEITWSLWAVQYSFLMTVSCGCVFLSWPGIVLKRAAWILPSKTALILAMTCGICAPIALLADLHHPSRFLNFYLHFQSGSWMAWGACFIVFYIGALLVYAWFAFMPVLARVGQEGGRYAPFARLLCRGESEEKTRALRAAATACLFAAILIMIYTGAEFLFIRARPLWNTIAIPALMALSGVAGAAGFSLALLRFASNSKGNGIVLSGVIAWTQAAILAVVSIWLAAGLSGLSTPAALAVKTAFPATSFRLMAGGFVALTLLIWLCAARRGGNGILLGTLTLCSAWLFRWLVYIGGQQMPKTGAGYYDYSLPLGYEGLLGMAGTLGLWAFVFFAITCLVPLSHLGENAEIGNIGGSS